MAKLLDANGNCVAEGEITKTGPRSWKTSFGKVFAGNFTLDDGLTKSPAEFKALFTLAELAEIVSAAKTNSLVEVFWDRVNTAKEIRLDSAIVDIGLVQLRDINSPAAGIVDDARIAEIKAGVEKS